MYVYGHDQKNGAAMSTRGYISILVRTTPAEIKHKEKTVKKKQMLL
jgi:hypothetical protein